MLKRLAICLLMACAAISAQDVGASEAPPRFGWVRTPFYDASGNLEYLCFAPVSASTTAAFTRAANTLTNIIVSTNVGTVNTVAAHGFTVGNKVVLSGWTVDTDLNATYGIATVPTSTSFTITTASVADAAYTDAGGVATLTGIRNTALSWVIQRFWYNTSNQLIKAGWADGSPSAAVLACASRATYAYR